MKKVFMISTVSSTIDQFNRRNIHILKSLGYQVTVISNFSDENPTSDDKKKKFVEYLCKNNIEVINIPFSRNIFNIKSLIKSYVKLKSIFKNEKNLSFIHVHTPIASVITRLLAKQHNIPVLYHAHGFHFYNGAPLLNWLIFYPLEKLLVNKTKAIIVINKEDYIRAQEMGYKNIYYVPGVGIDLKRKNNLDNINELRNKFKTGNNMIITSVGELNNNKNHEIVIKALNKVKVDKFIYLICGVGTKENELVSLVNDLGLTEKVIFMGYRTDVEDILSISDIFVFMSFREGLSVSLMESMKFGLPIVASNIRGNVDLIDKSGGYVSNPKDYLQLALNIEALLLDSDKRKDMGRYNQAKIQKYSKEIVDSKMFEIYSTLLQMEENNG